MISGQESQVNLDSLDSSEKSTLLARISELEAALVRVSLERDEYFQEVFESNRHAAWLAHERQNYSDRVRRYEGGLELSETKQSYENMLAVRDRYISLMEEMMSDFETRRCEIIKDYELRCSQASDYINFIDQYMWNSENSRCNIAQNCGPYSDPIAAGNLLAITQSEKLK